MPYRRHRNIAGNREGLTLVISLSILAIIAMIGIFTTKKVVMEQRIAYNLKTSTATFFMAESGLSHGQEVLAERFAANAATQAPASQPSWSFLLDTATSYYCEGCEDGDSLFDGAWTAGGIRILQRSGVEVGGLSYTYTVTAWNNNDGSVPIDGCGPSSSATFDCDGLIIIRSVAQAFSGTSSTGVMAESVQEKVISLDAATISGAPPSGMSQEFASAGKMSSGSGSDVSDFTMTQL